MWTCVIYLMVILHFIVLMAMHVSLILELHASLWFMSVKSLELRVSWFLLVKSYAEVVLGLWQSLDGMLLPS